MRAASTGPRRGAGPRLGAHMSIRGGLHRAVERAVAVSATALQVFVKSSRQWEAKPLGAREVDAFRENVRASGLVSSTLAHGSYLLNLASSDEELWRRSVAALAVEVERCARLGIPYLVVHPGAHLGSGERAGLRRVVRALDRLPCSRSRGRTGDATERVTVLLEVTAGQGSTLGYRFEHLGWVLERSGAGDRLGVCFDTCHALAAGYDFTNRAGYRRTFAEFDRTIGLERLRAFHLNDSKAGLGSRRDRHEHIGRGEVGLEAFRLILNDERFRGLPMILETPKGEDLAEDRRNLSVLRRLVGRRARGSGR